MSQNHELKDKVSFKINIFQGLHIISLGFTEEDIFVYFEDIVPNFELWWRVLILVDLYNKRLPLNSNQLKISNINALNLFSFV